eukprot:gene9549-6705_t
MVHSPANKKVASANKKRVSTKAAALAGVVSATSLRAKKGAVERKKDNMREEGEEEEEKKKPIRVSVKKRMQQRTHQGGSSDDDEEESGMGLVQHNNDDDDLSDLADEASAMESASDDEDENPFVQARREGTRLSYPVLRLRFLPAEFEEPQLFKFLNQFGATVLNCFCVRSRRTFQSLGIAYVQFDNPKVLPIAKEECDGMVLGGRTVRASVIQLHRAMPSKEAVAKRRKLAHAYRDKGQPIKQFVNPARANPIGMLVKATRSEVKNNYLLQKVGIHFASTAFAEQLRQVPSSQLMGKKKSMVEALLQLSKAMEERRASGSDKKKAAEGEEHTGAEEDILPRHIINRALGDAFVARHRSRGMGRGRKHKSQSKTKAATSKSPKDSSKPRKSSDASATKTPTAASKTTSRSAKKSSTAAPKKAVVKAQDEKRRSSPAPPLEAGAAAEKKPKKVRRSLRKKKSTAA